jgi:hypothetical protein
MDLDMTTKVVQRRPERGLSFSAPMISLKSCNRLAIYCSIVRTSREALDE